MAGYPGVPVAEGSPGPLKVTTLCHLGQLTVWFFSCEHSQ